MNAPIAAKATHPQAVQENGVQWGVILLSILVVVLGVVCIVVVATGILNDAGLQKNASIAPTEVCSIV